MFFPHVSVSHLIDLSAQYLCEKHLQDHDAIYVLAQTISFLFFCYFVDTSHSAQDKGLHGDSCKTNSKDTCS